MLLTIIVKYINKDVTVESQFYPQPAESNLNEPMSTPRCLRQACEKKYFSVGKMKITFI